MKIVYKNQFKYAEMARESDENDKLIIYIYSKEGTKPHFHFYRDIDELKNNAGGCIRLDVPEYFEHDSHTDKLKSTEKKYIIEWLKKKHYKYKKYSNFEVLCNDWDTNNPTYAKNITEMPNYNDLPEKT